MHTNGAILIGGEERQSPYRFAAIDPADGEALPGDFSESGEDDVVAACALAAAAAGPFAAQSPADRAHFIEAVADSILAIGDALIVAAMRESGLPRMRLEGERMRTVNQLRLFADEVREGGWLDVTIDPAMPDRAPPRADLRRMNIALGPVAVFGASNFPLAFSVAGGDTASALAAGCPVVVKGHPAHPATGELVARAVMDAVRACGLPAGVFAYLPGSGTALGAALVSNPRIKAVGFTGSRGGGLALCRIAAERPEPIPVYAEMASINPVVLLPHALEARAQALGAAFVGSLTLGAGQFCTNPGLVVALAGPALDRFVAAAADALGAIAPQVMLSPAIHAAYRAGVSARDGHGAARRVGSGQPGAGPNRCQGALFQVSAAQFLASPELADEVFGASSLIVACADFDEMATVLAGLEGQLTATVQCDEADAPAAVRLMPLLAAKAGRVLANGWPTGVEVSWAMVHGGPYPATSDARTTSVGPLAMHRFLRPVCYQDLPEALMPPALRDENPWHAPRWVNGRREQP